MAVLYKRKIFLTFFVAVNFSNENSSWLCELLHDLVSRLVKDGRQHVAEATPVRVKIDENKFIFS